MAHCTMFTSVLSTYFIFFSFYFVVSFSILTVSFSIYSDFCYWIFSSSSWSFLYATFWFLRWSILTVMRYSSGKCLDLKIYCEISYYQPRRWWWSTTNNFFMRLMAYLDGTTPLIFPPLGKISFLRICSYISTLFIA